MTSIAVRSKITSALVRQVEYLVNDKKADPTITDLEGRNAVSSALGIRLCNLFHFKSTIP